MRSSDISEVLDGWIADRKLSRRKKAFLETVFTQFCEPGDLYLPDVADSCYSSELDLPDGSFTIQVVAALLDHVEPATDSPCRLVKATEILVDDGHLTEEEAEEFYEAAL